MSPALRALDRGLAFLLLGAAFACPGIGSMATRGFEAVLSVFGYRYGFVL